MVGAKIGQLSVNLVLLHLSQFVSAGSIAWPAYSQQCRDDAGPPFMDDKETYGNGRYHDNQKVTPSLTSDGECVPKMQLACSMQDTKKSAYLEGPLDCSNKGWYCRIMPQKGWPNINLMGDSNFGHCNSTNALNDHGWDGDGHCHGSDVDSTYYWWIRDHFFRQYNGAVRCCCGWKDSSSPQYLYERRIANRCDFRREVKKSEKLSKCRDANEGHGKGFDDIGCDKSKYGDQLGERIPEDDGQCWEMTSFGYTEDGENDDGENDDGEDDECTELNRKKFFVKTKTKSNGNVKVIKKSCAWLQKKKLSNKNKDKKKVNQLCAMENGYGDLDPARDACKNTCDTCDTLEESE